MCWEMEYSRPRIEAALPNSWHHLGYQHLTEEQLKTVIHFVSGEGVFVSLPTGARQSLCYGLLPFMFDFCDSVPGSCECRKDSSA